MSTAPRIPLSRPALIRVLTTVQNTSTFWDQDILTIAGLCTAAEIEEHLWHCFKRLPEADKLRALESLQAHVAPLAA